MKEIKNKKTKIEEKTIKRDGSAKVVDYKQLIELTLDIIPQGGFAPKDIRERNRIQKAIDDSPATIIKLEDEDFKNLIKIIDLSRWPVRGKELSEFLETFVKE